MEQTILYDHEYRTLLCIMRDVTDMETDREKKEEISRRTIQVADRVVDKQMRVVQELSLIHI